MVEWWNVEMKLEFKADCWRDYFYFLKNVSMKEKKLLADN